MIIWNYGRVPRDEYILAETPTAMHPYNIGMVTQQGLIHVFKLRGSERYIFLKDIKRWTRLPKDMRGVKIDGE